MGVLKCEWHPVERAPGFALRRGVVGLVGSAASLLKVERDDRVQRAVQTLDPLDIYLEQLTCGELPGADQARLLRRA